MISAPKFQISDFKLRIAGAAFSGMLLFFSFPPFHFAFCGWFALIPLMFACTGVPARRAAWLGWISGAVFFISTLYWLRNVTIPGGLFLALYCALYLIPFAVFISLRCDNWRSASGIKNILWSAGAAAVWAAAEYARAIFATGFPWNMLGVSQYLQTPLIQIAELGGVYLISALMVFTNVSSGVTVLQYAAGIRGKKYRMHTELMAALILVAAAWSFGFHRMINRPAPVREPLHVALIQPNIPEVGNWDLADPELIYERLETLTSFAVITPNLDLVIWPETALPDFVRFSPRSADLVKKMINAGGGVPMLVGSMDVRYTKTNEPQFYNASFFFTGAGKLQSVYYKQHLVLFGEYIPFENYIPFIAALTPIESSFRPGRETVLFPFPDAEHCFSVLICFEDVLPYLSWRAVKSGAAWLINQTNDSWFDPDSGSVQHLANSVFRCIETRRPMLRCTNTGMTCALSPYGEISRTLAARTEGFQVVSVTPAPPELPATFYVRHGDLFAQACLLTGVALLIGLFIQRKKSNA
ncbi:MAG: apolipoprotein N-acyltransferase [Kiritimatiellales bacterium]